MRCSSLILGVKYLFLTSHEWLCNSPFNIDWFACFPYVRPLAFCQCQIPVQFTLSSVLQFKLIYFWIIWTIETSLVQRNIDWTLLLTRAIKSEVMDYFSYELLLLIFMLFDVTPNLVVHVGILSVLYYVILAHCGIYMILTKSNMKIEMCVELKSCIIRSVLQQVLIVCCEWNVSWWPRGLRRGSTAARLLGLWVRILLWAWMSVSFQCCGLSGRGPCIGLITRPEESC
jgi:hypothetical protein